MEFLKVKGKIKTGKLALSIMVPIVGGSLAGAFANRNTKEEYAELKRPSFSPPPWIFPLAWTALYTSMGVAKYRAAEKAALKKEEGKVLLPYNLQLGLNFLWSFLFFKWGLRGTALAEMALLLATITWTTYVFYQYDQTAGTLMVPYIAWVMFAMGLNASIWKLNK
ncbi:putative tryptophan-rich sensory-like protein [Planococcus halocryophilus Or1]|uniref:TspO protein n=1 Tax=Planococcus halocryophilus TaxID=1215089 RepID=A0A1C7DUY6_9BACL|nr:TspO/MBR family protein [Planococcus halocryophilus]ANU15222.1 TspO protein [Planococcus halocryophilus]EMF46977.1 putative tryptophan-rich sensory-like protein [Planococcus halocryophilus Or1]